MSLIERGVHKPHAQTLGRIAHAFDVSVAELRAELEAAEHPLVQAPPSQPSFDNHLRAEGQAEERRANWRSAVDNARRLQEGGRERLEELLEAWKASRARGELRSARRVYLDEIRELFNRAYGATHTLADILFAEGGIPAEDDWEEVIAADRFYRMLIEVMREAGFRVQVGEAGAPDLEEPDAA